MDWRKVSMTTKEEQLYKALKEAITNYRAFVIKNQQYNDIAKVSDIQLDNSVAYYDADISSLEKCTGGSFKGTTCLHFFSNIDNEQISGFYHIIHGEYIVDKYNDGEFNISIKSIICE